MVKVINTLIEKKENCGHSVLLEVSKILNVQLPVFSKQVKTYGYAGYLTLEQADKKDKQPVGGLGLEFKF